MNGYQHNNRGQRPSTPTAVMKSTQVIVIVTVLLTLPWAVAQPKFTIQPTNTSVSLGATAQFRVVATSTNTPITYQGWFKEAALDTNANPSAAKSTLSLTNVTLANDGPYFVVASDTVGSTNSKVATLTVDPTFTKITAGAIVNDAGYSYTPAWGDYTGDGWLDLFVGNGGNEGPTVPFLYRNDQHGGLVRVTAAEVGTLATDAVQACEGHWADYDNDGNLDLFIGSAKPGDPSRLYLNEGNGHFRRITQNVGINQSFSPTAPWGSAWADYDNDGFLDLYLATGWVAQNGADMLWRNQGDGTFVRCQTIPFPVMNVNHGAWGDAENDGDLDLLVGNKGSGNNAFYRNNGDGTFTNDTAAGLGPGGGEAVTPVWADFNNDGYLDVFMACSVAPCYFYVNNKDGTFKQVTTGPQTQISGLCASAGDYDNDGNLDLFITRGQGSGGTCSLFHNEGDGTFVSVVCGSLTADNHYYTGCAWADYDNDGFLDLFVGTVAGEKNVLYHNNGNTNAWLTVRLIGTLSNRDAIGAKVLARSTIRGSSTLQMRQIGGGMLGDPRAHFGLGDATNATTLRIEWPSGLVQEFADVAPGQILTITEHQVGATAPSLTMSKAAGGPAQLTLTGQTNLLYAFEASTNLAQWTKIAVRTNQTGTVDFTDNGASNYSQRFYRAVAP